MRTGKLNRSSLAILAIPLMLVIRIAPSLFAQKKIDTIRMEKRIDEVMTPLVKDKLLSGAVLIAVNKAVVFHKAYGLADIEAGLPNTTETQFGICSITKMFTALSIMQLVEKGRLELQDRLNAYIPDFPRGEDITIYHLLTHTSGLPSYNPLEHYARFQDVIGRIKTLPLKFKPGTDFDYSNSGYALLTFLIEKISGLSYEDYVAKNILVPSYMNRSGMLPADGAAPTDRLAVGYSLNETGGLQRSEPRREVAKGDGALFSTTGDLYQFSRSLLSDILISPKTRETMFRPFKQAHGIGCIVEDYKGWTVISHPGGTQGLRTKLAIYVEPENTVTVICLFNTDFMLDHLVNERIEKIALGESVTPLFSRNASWIHSLEKFAGTYEIEPGDTFTVTIDKGRILFQSQAQERQEAFPFNERSIYIKNVNSRYHFSEDKTSHAITAVGFIATPETAFMVNARKIK